MRIEPYDSSMQEIWDDFIQKSKNGTFLFCRDYMEYHSSRFVDASLFFVEKEEVIAVMPANISDDVLVSHGGLTFGGIVFNSKMMIQTALDIFQCLIDYLGRNGVTRLIYKAIPHIYHDIPAEEDLYALFRLGASLIRRDLSSTILLCSKLKYSHDRLNCIKKAKKSELKVYQSVDFGNFMDLVASSLARKHGKTPVHSADEMRSLAARFPENIRLFLAQKGDRLMGGVIIYESKHVAHAQYIAATDEGKKMGALDLTIDFLIGHYAGEKKYFDFGISTDHDGMFLDTGLVSNKQSFGARSIVYDFYEIKVAP